jgi:hypothetical protein
MDETTGELRRDLDEQRARIGHTVDEIENRVVPGRIIARRRYGLRQRYVSIRERLMGDEDDDDRYLGSPYGYGYAYGSPESSDQGGEGRTAEAMEGARQRAHMVGEQMHDAPQRARARTRGAPIPAGLLAMSAGFLVGSLLPPSRREQQMAHRMEPALEGAAHEVRAAGEQVMDELREPAKEAADELRTTARSEARATTDEVRDTASEQASKARRG